MLGYLRLLVGRRLPVLPKVKHPPVFVLSVHSGFGFTCCCHLWPSLDHTCRAEDCNFKEFFQPKVLIQICRFCSPDWDILISSLSGWSLIHLPWLAILLWDAILYFFIHIGRLGRLRSPSRMLEASLCICNNLVPSDWPSRLTDLLHFLFNWGEIYQYQTLSSDDFFVSPLRIFSIWSGCLL